MIEVVRLIYHYSCQFRNCFKRTHVGCFCHLRHSAWSPHCRCWSPPSSLFLVCKTILDDAQAVFFGKNRFVITPLRGCYGRADTSPDRPDLSIFLKDVVPLTALRYLRFLEVIISPFEYAYLQEEEPAYQEWIQTIDSASLCSPSMLTIRVYFNDHLADRQGCIPNGLSFRADVTHEQALAIWYKHQRTMKPFSTLREHGLQRLFVHAAEFTAWTKRGDKCASRRGHQGQGPPSPEHARICTRMGWYLEYIVMGSDYSSELAGKAQLEDSQWVESDKKHLW